MNWRKEPSALFCNWGRGPSQAERSSTETLERVHACMVRRCQIKTSKRANLTPTGSQRKKKKERRIPSLCHHLLGEGPGRRGSYLQNRVVRRDVGVVVPAGRHTVEKHLLRSAVVVVEEPSGVGLRVLIIARLPLISQSRRQSQQQ